MHVSEYAICSEEVHGQQRQISNALVKEGLDFRLICLIFQHHRQPHPSIFFLRITNLTKTFFRAVNLIPVPIPSLFRNVIDLALMSLDRDVPKFDIDRIEPLG